MRTAWSRARAWLRRGAHACPPQPARPPFSTTRPAGRPTAARLRGFRAARRRRTEPATRRAAPPDGCTPLSSWEELSWSAASPPPPTQTAAPHATRRSVAQAGRCQAWPVLLRSGCRGCPPPSSPGPARLQPQVPPRRLPTAPHAVQDLEAGHMQAVGRRMERGAACTQSRRLFGHVGVASWHALGCRRRGGLCVCLMRRRPSHFQHPEPPVWRRRRQRHVLVPVRCGGGVQAAACSGGGADLSCPPTLCPLWFACPTCDVDSPRLQCREVAARCLGYNSCEVAATIEVFGEDPAPGGGLKFLSFSYRWADRVHTSGLARHGQQEVFCCSRSSTHAGRRGAGKAAPCISPGRLDHLSVWAWQAPARPAPPEAGRSTSWQ